MRKDRLGDSFENGLYITPYLGRIKNTAFLYPESGRFFSLWPLSVERENDAWRNASPACPFLPMPAWFPNGRWLERKQAPFEKDVLTNWLQTAYKIQKRWSKHIFIEGTSSSSNISAIGNLRVQGANYQDKRNTSINVRSDERRSYWQLRPARPEKQTDTLSDVPHT